MKIVPEVTVKVCFVHTMGTLIKNRAIPLRSGKVGEKVFILEQIGIPLEKNNVCQRFKYPKNRAVSMVLLVFETLKNIYYQRGEIPLFMK